MLAWTSLDTSSNLPSNVEPNTTTTIGLPIDISKATTKFPPAFSVYPVFEAMRPGMLATSVFVFFTICSLLKELTDIF